MQSIKAYSRPGLALYDALIMNGLAPHVWGCPSERLVDHYRDHLRPNHADIGVGTGYALDKCGFDVPDPRLVLIDLQPNCLQHTMRRLARFKPRWYLRDALRPIRGVDGPAFDSVALGGILHCLPGNLQTKSAVFDNIASLTRSGTKIFGYTLVSDEVPRRLRRRVVHALLNKTRVVDNDADRLADLHSALTARFADVRVETSGSMALFSAVIKGKSS